MATFFETGSPLSDGGAVGTVKSLLISRKYFPPQTGGISSYMHAVATTLGAARICCLTGVRSGDEVATASSSIKVYRCPSAFHGNIYVQAAALGLMAIQLMIRERPRVVQVATADDGYWGLQFQRWSGLPLVIYAHGNEILEAAQSSWEAPRRSLRKASRVLANSHFTAGLVQQAGVDPRRIEIVHPGCDVERFRPVTPSPVLRQRLLGNRQGDRIILTVGNLVARKGHDVVIRALPGVLHTIKDVTYLIAGEGPHRAELERLALAIGVKDRVIFAGRIADEEIPHVYALCDLFIMPSREERGSCDVEGFGMVFLEANACGKPVIAGKSGGISDAVLDGVTGLQVNPLDPKQVADAILRILSDGDLAARLGQQGRARIAREFRWDCVADRIQHILDAVVQETSGGH